MRAARLALSTFGVLLLAVGLFVRAGWPFALGGLILLVAAARTR